MKFFFKKKHTVSEKSIHHPEIGEIKFVSSVKARHIRISVGSSGIRVTVPKYATMEEAMGFVSKKSDWIKQSMLKVAKHKHTIFTPETEFSTHDRKLQLIEWKSESFRVQRTKDALKIFYPQGTDLLSDHAQTIIRGYIEQTIRKEAKEYLPQRTAQLAEKYEFSYHGVSVKNVISRWGSCSASNHINLNMHLMRLPQHLCDYVILHELVHTVHKNHAAVFWNSLDKLTDMKAKQLSKEIKQYRADNY